MFLAVGRAVGWGVGTPAQADAPWADVFPDAHNSHVLEPEAAWYLPAAHAVHVELLVCPVAAL